MTEKKRQKPARVGSKPLQARYANYFEVGHNAYEFIFDFGQYHPEEDAAHMHCRIVTGPPYAKLLCGLLHTAIGRFEEEYGVIDTAGDDLDPLEMVQQSIAGFDGGPSTSGRREK
jgi:Protein of unknown function (DUF3467)